MSTYQELTREWKDFVKSYNVNINTNNTGTYVDVVANATGALAAGVSANTEMVRRGNQLDTANEYMLENWATSLGLVRRKTGFYATGDIELEISGSTLTVPEGTEFSLAELVYTVIDETVIDGNNSSVTVQAEQVGAEYNIISGITMSTDLSGVDTATSGNITGGSGLETVLELKNRIGTSIRNRRTSTMATDFTQFALETFNYVYTVILFDDSGLVPIGARVIVANTIEDFELASKKANINEVAASQNQLDNLLEELKNFKDVTAVVETATVDTQVVTGLEVNYTADTTLTSAQNDEIIEKTREALLKFQDSYLYPRSLRPEIEHLVTSYYFTSFTPIEKTSVQMDSITISTNQYSL